MKSFYKLLLVVLIAIGVSSSAMAVRYIDITSNDWENIVLENNSNGTISKLTAPTEPGATFNYSTPLALAQCATRGPQIQVKEGYTAVITYTIAGQETKVATPNATPDEGYAATYFFPWATYAPENTVKNYINVTVTPDGGADTPSVVPFPEVGYGFDVTWNIPGSITLKKGFANISLDANATYYQYWDEEAENEYELPTIKVYANDGYKFNKVYYLDEDNNEVIVKTYYDYYMLNSNVSKQHVYIEMAQDVADSKFSVTFVNTPDCFQSIKLTNSGKEINNITFSKGVAQEIQFDATADNKAEFLFSTATWQLDSENEKLYRQVYKLTKNGQDITEESLRDATGTKYYEVSIADGDNFEIQPFEVDPEKATYTLTLDAPEGLIKSVFNRSTYKMVELVNNQIEVIEGTILQFNFNDDWTFTSATYAGTALEDWDNTGGKVTVNATGTLKIEATTTQYSLLDYTVYVVCPEGVNIFEGNGNGQILALENGEATTADITLPAISTASESAYTMPAGQTYKYTVKVSSKYGRILVMAKSGYWIRTIRGANTSSAETAGVASQTDQTVYVYAQKIQNDSKALVYFRGDASKVYLKAAGTHGATTEHRFTTQGYSEIEFDAAYEGAFKVMVGESIDNMKVFMNNASVAADENGVYSFDAKNGSVIKIYADGTSYTGKSLDFSCEEGAGATVVYDRTFEFSDLDGGELVAYWGTEVAITPNQGTLLYIDDELVEVAAGETYTLTVTTAAEISFVKKADPTILLTPATGSTVESLETITVAFDGATTVTVNDEMGLDEVTLRAGWAHMAFLQSVDAVEGAECPTFTFTFDCSQCSNATYNLLIPAGFFTVDGNATMDITATYTLLKPITNFNYFAEPETIVLDADAIAWGAWFGIFFEDESINVDVKDESLITVTNNDVTLDEVNFGAEGNTFMIGAMGLDAGTVKVVLKAGALSLSGFDSPAMELTFNAVVPAEVTYNITPADGTTTGNLAQVTIEFEGATSVEVYQTSGVFMSNGDYSYSATGTISIVEDAEVPTAVVTFDPAPTVAGQYSLSVSYGAFTINGCQSSDQLSATINFVPAQTVVVNGEEVVANGGTVAYEANNVEEFTFEFPYAEEVTLSQEKVSEITLTVNATESTQARVAATTYTASEVVEKVGAENITYVVKFADAPKTTGSFTLSVPAGLFVADGVETAASTHAVTVNEYISSGLSSITIDANDGAEYFNLQGIRVLNPSNGIFIRRQGNTVTRVLVK